MRERRKERGREKELTSEQKWAFTDSISNSDRKAWIKEHFAKTTTTFIHIENLTSEVNPTFQVFLMAK